MTKPDDGGGRGPRRARTGSGGSTSGVTDTAGADGSLALAAPANVTAEPGAGHVGLGWDLVPGAAGYVIERTGVEHTGEDGDGPRILRARRQRRARRCQDRRSRTRGWPSSASQHRASQPRIYRYRVGAVAGAEYPVWSWSAPVQSATRPGDPGPVLVRVDASAVTGTLNRVWRMVGSERLSQLLLGSDEGGTERNAGKQIAAEFAEALRLAHDDLGVTMVRAHAILHDDNAVVTPGRRRRAALRLQPGRRHLRPDARLGMRPVVELSFMPAALARDPQQTVFAYRGIISPPADWAEWRQLVTALAAPPGASGTASTRSRSGRSRSGTSRTWSCSGPARRPSTCGCTTSRRGRSRRSTRGCASAAPPRPPPSGSSRSPRTPQRHDVPLDFVTTHTYGNLPLDVRPALQRHGLDGHPDLVDRVGRRLDPLRPDPRRRRSARRSCSAASTTRRAGSTPWRTG